MDFLDGIATVFMPYSGFIYVAVAIFARMSLFIFLLPGIGEQSIPVRIRLTIAMGLTLLILPILLQPGMARPQTISAAAALIGKESIFGLFLGLSFRLMVFGLQIVGNIVAQSLSLSQVLGEGIATEPNTTISTILMLSGVTLLVTLNLHTEAFYLFVQSYEAFPLGAIIDFDEMAYSLSRQAMDIFHICFSLSFPFLLLNFAYNLLLGFLNKAMPQLLVSFVGMPAITGIGILLVALCGDIVMGLWLEQYQGLTRDLFSNFGRTAP